MVSLSDASARGATRERGVPARQRAEGVVTAELTDDTLGGYRRVHERAPAFGGMDGRAYSVGTFVDEAPDAEGRYGAALLFVRWSDAGDRPVAHLETDYLAWGATPALALAPLSALTLAEVKAHLDRCIELERPGKGAGGAGGPGGAGGARWE